jgi:putative PIN family toxin of toxin-antitoxin system
VPLRLVLDTNVWLDWLVFADPRAAPIKAAVAAGTAEIYIGPECERELERVLAYRLGKSVLDGGVQADCLAACRRIARWIAPAEDAYIAPPQARSRVYGRLPLPRCRDPEDQMFLELARACHADFLITKDRALLELAARKYQPVPFRIVTPEEAGDALHKKTV